MPVVSPVTLRDMLAINACYFCMPPWIRDRLPGITTIRHPLNPEDPDFRYFFNRKLDAKEAMNMRFICDLLS